LHANRVETDLHSVALKFSSVYENGASKAHIVRRDKLHIHGTVGQNKDAFAMSLIALF
jgi:hypothetical protein